MSFVTKTLKLVKSNAWILAVIAALGAAWWIERYSRRENYSAGCTACFDTCKKYPNHSAQRTLCRGVCKNDPVCTSNASALSGQRAKTVGIVTAIDTTKACRSQGYDFIDKKKLKCRCWTKNTYVKGKCIPKGSPTATAHVSYDQAASILKARDAAKMKAKGGCSSNNDCPRFQSCQGGQCKCDNSAGVEWNGKDCVCDEDGNSHNGTKYTWDGNKCVVAAGTDVGTGNSIEDNTAGR